MAYNKILFYPSSKNETIHRNLNMLNNPGPSQNNRLFENFDRFYSIYPDIEATNLLQYVFIVRPSCNIVDRGGDITDECKHDNYITMMVKTEPILAESLCDGFNNEHDFIPFLTGRVESLQVPDLSLKTYTLDQPYTNYRIPYPGTSIESVTGGSFDITFRETKTLKIHKLFNLWIHYISAVKRNTCSPKMIMMKENRFDYACSVYQITCLPDGETIVWWGKYTGCIPKNVANSDLSFNLRGGVEPRTSISFDYFMYEPHHPEILSDFNDNAHVGTSANYVPLYDAGNAGSGTAMVGAPFISVDGNQLKLRWQPKYRSVD